MFKHFHLQKNKTVLSTYVITILSVSLIPFLISTVIIYRTASNNIMNQLIENEKMSLSNIEQNMFDISRTYSDVAAKLAKNYIRFSLYDKNSTNINYDSFYQFVQSEENITSIFSPIKSVYIYNPSNKYVLVNNAFCSIDALDDSSWLDLLNSDSTNQSTWYYNRIPSIDTLIFSYDKNNYVIINIDQNLFYNELFSSIDEYAFVVSDNVIIWKNKIKSVNPADLSNNVLKYDGNKYYVIRHKDNYNGRTYISLISAETLLSTRNSMTFIIMLTAVIILFLVLIMSMLLANSLSKPIKNIVSTMPVDAQHGKNEIEEISDYILSLNESHQNLFRQNTLYEQEAAESNVLKFLRGIPLDNSERGIDDIFPDYIKNFTVISIQFDYNHSAQQIVKYISDIKNSFINYSDKLNYFMFYIDKQRITMLLFSSVDFEAHNSYTKSLRDIMQHSTDITPVIGISKTVNNAYMLHESFLRSLELIEYRLYSDKRIIFDDNYEFSSDFNTSLDEVSLTSAINSKNHEKATKILSDIFSEIRDKRPHPDIAISYLALLNTRLKNTIVSLGFSYDELMFKNHVSFHPTNYNLDDYYNYFNTFINNIIAGLNIKTTSKNTKLIENIKQHILDNIENDISLAIVSDYYGMTPQYLSLLFKQETNQNFVKFVTNAKINHAKELLAETNLTVKEIASIIGYNERSFFAIFKKCTGITPKEYRLTYNKK